MKNPKGFIITVLIIALPIVWLCFSLNNIKDKYGDSSGDALKKTEDEINEIINTEISNALNSDNPDFVEGEENTEAVSAEPTEEGQSSIYGNPISKLIDGAKINVSSANIYQEPDETSSIVAAVYKDTEVTIQDYPNGWSNIKTGDLSGWIKSELVTRPDEATSLTTAVGHSATILASTLNVRSTPEATSDNKVDQLDEGETVNIIGANDDETWFEIQYGTKTGWISGNPSYVKVNY